MNEEKCCVAFNGNYLYRFAGWLRYNRNAKVVEIEGRYMVLVEE